MRRPPSGGRREPPPFDEAAPDGVVLEFMEHVGAGHKTDRHRVRMRRGHAGVFEDDVRESDFKRRRSQRQRMHARRIGGESVQELGRARGRRLAEQPGQRGAVGAVPPAGRAQAPVEVHLDAGRPGEQGGRQSGCAPVEVVRDSHRAHRVRTRRSWPDSEEIVQRGLHRPCEWVVHGPPGCPRDRTTSSSTGAASRAPGSLPRRRRRRWPCSCRSTPASSDRCGRTAARRSPCPSG